MSMYNTVLTLIMDLEKEALQRCWNVGESEGA